MKSLKVDYVESLSRLSIIEVSNFLDENLAKHEVNQVNWPASFPHKPDCSFKIARTADKLYLKFFVKDSNLRAIYTVDQEPVWQDSCVEFFCKQPDMPHYYNFEFNCIGTCLATSRVARNEGIKPLSGEELQKVERFSSLGTSAIEEKEGDFEWSLTVAIPFSIIGMQDLENPSKLTANFYKCGDGTSRPHYISWNVIATENPDFHRPDFFGELNF